MPAITLDAIEAKQTELSKLIAQFKDQAMQPTLRVLQEVEIELHPGEHYAGPVLDADGNLMRALAVYMAGTDRIPGYAHHNSPLPAPDILNGLCYTLQLSTEDITKDVKKTIKAETVAEIKALQAELKPKPATPSTPATVASETKPATNPAKRNRKINAEEAQAGIAEAMQATEPDTVPNCWAGDSFAIGQTVRITTDDNRLGLIARKHGGKTGTITRREDGGGYWDVTFKGRGGGVAMFAEDQLEALQA